MRKLNGRPTFLATLALAVFGWALVVPATTGFGMAHAQSQVLRVGAVISITGESAALGASEANTLALLADQLAGRSGVQVELTVLDDGSQVEKTIELVHGLLAANEVDAIICCTRSEAALAVVAPMQAARVPLISLAAAAPIANPAESRRWVFSTAPSDTLILHGVVADMRARGVSDMAFVGLADAFGESGLVELQLLLPGTGINLDTVVRYDAQATSYTAPVLAATLSRPQVVLVWGIVDDSARMVKELRTLGFGGDIYVSHGVGNDRFIELAGAAAEGVRLAVGPLLVVEDLAANATGRDAILAYANAYAAAYPVETATTFGGHAHDAVMTLVNAADLARERDAFDTADRVARRLALRDAIEGMGPFVGIGGVFDFSGTDHSGLDDRAYVIAEIKDGAWRLAD